MNTGKKIELGTCLGHESRVEVNLKEVHQYDQHDDCVEFEVGDKDINLMNKFRFFQGLNQHSLRCARFAIVVDKLPMIWDGIVPTHNPIEANQPESQECRRTEGSNFVVS